MMTNEIKIDGTTLVTSEVRLSYVSLEQPREAADGKAKYSCMVMIPKSDTQLIQAINQAIANAVEVGKQRGKGDTSRGRNPLKDGDAHTNMKGELLAEKAPELRGHYFLNASANLQRPPRLYTPRPDGKIEQAQQGAFYSGCYARVYLNFYAYSNQSAGVLAGINSAIKTRDGELLGEAGMTDADAFGAEIVTDATGDEFM